MGRGGRKRDREEAAQRGEEEERKISMNGNMEGTNADAVIRCHRRRSPSLHVAAQLDVTADFQLHLSVISELLFSSRHEIKSFQGVRRTFFVWFIRISVETINWFIVTATAR